MNVNTSQSSRLEKQVCFNQMLYYKSHTEWQKRYSKIQMRTTLMEQWITIDSYSFWSFQNGGEEDALQQYNLERAYALCILARDHPNNKKAFNR